MGKLTLLANASKGGTMKDFLSCCLISMLLGATVGAVLTTKNKQIADMVKTGSNMVEDKIEDVKKSIDKAKRSNK